MLKEAEYKAMTIHNKYVQDVNKFMVERFLARFTEIFPHIKLIPDVVNRARENNKFYEITSEDNSDKIKIKPFEKEDTLKYFEGFRMNLDGYSGFVLIDEAYRKTTAYVVLYREDDFIILNYKPTEFLNPMIIGNIKERKLYKNDIQDLEGLLWVLCSILDVFFDFQVITVH